MAGHTLLKVVVGFSWSMLLLEDFFISSSYHIFIDFNTVDGFEVRSSLNTSVRFYHFNSYLF